MPPARPSSVALIHIQTSLSVRSSSVALRTTFKRFPRYNLQRRPRYDLEASTPVRTLSVAPPPSPNTHDQTVSPLVRFFSVTPNSTCKHRPQYECHPSNGVSCATSNRRLQCDFEASPSACLLNAALPFGALPSACLLNAALQCGALPSAFPYSAVFNLTFKRCL